jgi:putative alpha-1,2-mannosidase
MRRSEAWAKDQHIYFVAKFSEPFVESKNLETGGLNIINRHAFKFSNQSKSIYVKVGISTVSIEGARKNLEAELPEWDFEKTKQVAEEMWNKELGKIEVVSSDKEKMKIFYINIF